MENKEPLDQLNRYLCTIGELTTITMSLNDICRMKPSDNPLMQITLIAEKIVEEQKRLEREKSK